MNNSHDQRVISVDGNELHYTDAGAGDAVLLLQPVLNKALVDQLSMNCRVIGVEVRNPGKGVQILEALGPVLRQLRISNFGLIAESELASAAIAHAIAASDSVEALVLIAPVSGASNSASVDLPLEQIGAPTLVLFGTRDRVVAPEAGRVYARRIPKCFYTLVYDSGHDIATDRPRALYAIMRDFLAHREKFVFPHESSVINP
jgi:pimeloyl-ACP methyl ester carboxylesterase